MARLSMDKVSTCELSTPFSIKDHSILNDRNVYEILQRKLNIQENGVTLIKWQLESLGRANGFLGEYHHLLITVKTEGSTEKIETLRFFAKTPPPKDSPQFKFLSRYDSFNKEIVFYTNMVKHMGTGKGSHKWCVECYFSRKDTVLVLEDASLDGYTTLTKYIPFDYDHCVWIVKTLAQFHSRSLIYDQRLRTTDGASNIERLYGHLLGEVLFAQNDLTSAKALKAGINGICSLVDMVEYLEQSEKKNLKNRIVEWCGNVSHFLSPSKVYKNLICHRDVWSNNIMFKHDTAGKPIGCYLIDYQFARYCPPCIDFITCLYLTTTRSIRDEHFQTLVEIYHHSLGSCLKEEGLDIETCLSWTEFSQSCYELKFIGIIYAILNLQVMLISDEAIDEFMGSIERIENILYGADRAILLQNLYKNHQCFRKRMDEVIIEANECFGDILPTYR